MAKLRCIKDAKVGADDTPNVLEVGAFWQAGEEYELRLVEAAELLAIFPKSFEPLDDEATVALERAKAPARTKG